MDVRSQLLQWFQLVKLNHFYSKYFRVMVLSELVSCIGYGAFYDPVITAHTNFKLGTKIQPNKAHLKRQCRANEKNTLSGYWHTITANHLVRWG